MSKCVTYDMALRDDISRDVLSTCKVRMSARRRLVAPSGQTWVCVGWVNPLAPDDWLDDTDVRYAMETSGYAAVAAREKAGGE